MSKKDQELRSELNSLCDLLSGLEREARTKEREIKTKLGGDKRLIESIDKLRAKNVKNERKFDRKMFELRKAKSQAEKSHSDESNDLKVRKEFQAGLLEASKIELNILKREMEELKEVKMDLLKVFESYNIAEVTSRNDVQSIEENEEISYQSETSSREEKIEEILDNLPELERKAEQFVFAASSHQDEMRSRLGILRDVITRIMEFKRELKEIHEKNELRSRSDSNKGNAIEKENVKKQVKDPIVGEMTKEEVEKLSVLDEEIIQKESEYEATLKNIDWLLESQTVLEKLKEERIDKISLLTARLQDLKSKQSSSDSQSSI